ncbi:hypothetical protein EAF00_002933 [Botryotinia globosa]|nr:hypothetical protein EAF00_002933 [Botryotinia globosa]
MIQVFDAPNISTMRYLCDPLPDSLVRNQYTDMNLHEYTKSQSPRMEVRCRETTNADCSDDECENSVDDFEDFFDEFEDLETRATDINSEPDLKQRETDSKPKKSILERLPAEIREMVFVFCGRSTFCSADQGPNLLKALRGQRQAYTHALDKFERLNSYELGAELRSPTSEICNEIQDMTGLMSHDSQRSTAKYHIIRAVQFYHDLSRIRERTSRIILCQSDRGDWTFLKNFFTFVLYRRVKRVITQLPNPQNRCVNATYRYDAYYQDNYYESYRAKQDAFVFAVIESINQKVGVEGVVLGRSKDSLSGFCIWEAPEGECMDWNRDVIESCALRGGFGKTFLDYENNVFELREDTRRRCFVIRNRHEQKVCGVLT